MNEPIFKPAHNSPPHLFVADWFYMLTGSTYKKQPFIQSDKRKTEFINSLHTASDIYHWIIIALVELDNHCHLILKSPQNNPGNLPKFVASYHKFTARQWNAPENLSGRMVWRNYWDTCIRSQQDYQNRLRYIFWNPVKHELVRSPMEYQHCNYKDFMEAKWLVIGNTPVEVKDVPEF
jgi:putative transposase